MQSVTTKRGVRAVKMEPVSYAIFLLTGLCSTPELELLFLTEGRVGIGVAFPGVVLSNWSWICYSFSTYKNPYYYHYLIGKRLLIQFRS